MTGRPFARVGGAALLGMLLAMVGVTQASASPIVERTSAAVILPASSPIITPACSKTVLRYGSRGDCVKQLQFAMNLFFNRGLAVDGSYGPATTTSVRWFQQRYGLTLDGITGPQTWSALLWVDLRFSNGWSY